MPRWWAFGLAMLATLLAIAGVLDSRGTLSLSLLDPIAAPLGLEWDLDSPSAHRPWLHISMVACTAGVLALLPRLLPMLPSSRWIQRIAPLTLAAVLFFFLPLSSFIGLRITAQQERGIRLAIEELHRVREVVAEASEYTWSRTPNEFAAASRIVNSLGALQPGEIVTEEEIWRMATVLGLQADLGRAASELIEAVGAATDPGSIPRLSTMDQPALWYDVENRTWQEDPGFLDTSRLCGTYYAEMATSPGRAGTADRRVPVRAAAL